jgi:hypothetical protein
MSPDGFYAHDLWHPVGPELAASEWLKHLAKFGPFFLEFTGGEPLMYPGFREMVRSGIQWAITSNTLLNVDNIDLGNCLSWTASWHGIHDPFVNNVRLLKSRFPYVSVSVVTRFAHVKEDIETAYRLREETRTRVNLLRELNPGVDWRDTDEWARVVAMRDDGFLVVEEDIPPVYEFTQGWRCCAGKDYFACWPDGSISRCYSGIMNNQIVGHVSTYVPDDTEFTCNETCYACALDYRFRTKKV